MAEGLDGALVQEAAGAHRGHHPRTAGIERTFFQGGRAALFLCARPLTERGNVSIM